MKTLDRVFLTFLMIIMLALCVFTVLFCLGVFSIPELATALIAFDGSWLYKIIAIVASIILFVLSLKLIFHRSKVGTVLSGDGKASSAENKQMISVGGNIQITAEAVNDIMQKAAKGNGVTSADCRIIKNQDGTFAAQINAIMADGINVPEAAQAMDLRIKENLAAACGLPDVATKIIIGK